MRLEIVVSPCCWASEDARAIATEMRTCFPSLDVEVIDLGGPNPVPPAVFATPTYLLDGSVISLGNPTREQLVRTIEARGCKSRKRP